MGGTERLVGTSHQGGRGGGGGGGGGEGVGERKAGWHILILQEINYEHQILDHHPIRTRLHQLTGGALHGISVPPPILLVGTLCCLPPPTLSGSCCPAPFFHLVSHRRTTDRPTSVTLMIGVSYPSQSHTI